MTREGLSRCAHYGDSIGTVLSSYFEKACFGGGMLAVWNWRSSVTESSGAVGWICNKTRACRMVFLDNREVRRTQRLFSQGKGVMVFVTSVVLMGGTPVGHCTGREARTLP